MPASLRETLIRREAIRLSMIKDVPDSRWDGQDRKGLFTRLLIYDKNQALSGQDEDCSRLLYHSKENDTFDT